MSSPLAIGTATAAALAAGAVNSVAGGGTLITFPALLGLGMPSIQANATSTIALWPGVAGAMWGYRGELRGARNWVLLLTIPSVLGGILGALLLVKTPAGDFDRIAPFLVLAATLLFMAQGFVARLLNRTRGEDDTAEPELKPKRVAAYLFFQFLVSVYGGYFGAGIGILMLAALGMMGLKNIHRMNGLKSWAAFCTNGVAVILFAWRGIIDWPIGIAMTAGSIVGGYAGARIAQHVGQGVVRRMIIGVGFAATAYLLLRKI